ncbi:unnamed protein product [Gordionus sp. m RMFG-2023]
MNETRFKIRHFSLVGEYAKRTWIRSQRGKYWSCGADILVKINKLNEEPQKEIISDYIYIHSLILACHGISEYFLDKSEEKKKYLNEKYFDQTKSKSNNQSLNSINLHDFLIIEYCYLGDINLNIRNILAVKACAEKLGIKYLLFLIKNILNKLVEKENILITLDAAIKTDSKEMIEYGFKDYYKIKDNEYYDKCSYVNMTPRTFCHFLSRDDLPILVEIEVILLILNWIAVSPNHIKFKKDSKLITKFMEHVRWNFVKERDIFDLLDILGSKILTNPIIMKEIMKGNW